MLRRLFWLLCALLLASCTLAPEQTPQQVLVCPTCAAVTPCGATVQPAATKTNTPVPPTATKVPPTATKIPATATPKPSATPTAAPSATAANAGITYQVQAGTPRLVQSFAHPSLGCKWMGVGGQVFGLDGKPVTDQVVVVTGFLNNNPVDLLGISGGNKSYGPAGFEIQLASQPIASSSTLFIQLFDLNGSPQSYPVIVDTSAACSKNLVLVNFKKVK